MKLKRIITGVLASVMCVGAFNVTSAFASDETNIFIVGDSTSCIYGYDDNYALPRAGWGMYLGDFLRSNIMLKTLLCQVEVQKVLLQRITIRNFYLK